MTEVTTPVCAHGSLARQCRVCELEQEVADLTRQLHTEQDRRWAAEGSLSVRYALRREIEQALGITPGMTNNDALRAGLAAITSLRADCDRLRAVVAQVEWINYGPGDGMCSIPGECYESCPWCGCSRDEGHAPDCARQAALGRGEGE